MSGLGFNKEVLMRLCLKLNHPFLSYCLFLSLYSIMMATLLSFLCCKIIFIFNSKSIALLFYFSDPSVNEIFLQLSMMCICTQVYMETGARHKRCCWHDTQRATEDGAQSSMMPCICHWHHIARHYGRQCHTNC